MKSIEIKSGQLKTYAGERISALTWARAEAYCEKFRPYLRVIGELCVDIPCKDGTLDPDWDNAIDYHSAENN